MDRRGIRRTGQGKRVMDDVLSFFGSTEEEGRNRVIHDVGLIDGRRCGADGAAAGCVYAYNNRLTAHRILTSVGSIHQTLQQCRRRCKA